jgi:hypothetical protein
LPRRCNENEVNATAQYWVISRSKNSGAGRKRPSIHYILDREARESCKEHPNPLDVVYLFMLGRPTEGVVIHPRGLISSIVEWKASR